MPDAQGLHRCPICLKGYKRREHLQRHRSSHNAERPHRCILCSASFQRTDVLKRHLQTCDGSSTASSGRRRACDRCVRQKKACNSLQPCQNCEKRAAQCQYSNAPPASMPSATNDVPSLEPPIHNSTPVPPFAFDDVPFTDIDTVIHQAVSAFPLLPDQSVNGDWFGINFAQNESADAGASQAAPGSSPAASDSRGYSFDFLYDFTSRTGLVSSFECATLEQRQQIVASFDRAYLEQQEREPFVPVAPLFPASNPSSQDAGYIEPDMHAAQGLVPYSYWLHNPIVIKLQKIVLLVKNVVTVKPNNSTVTLTWSPELEQRCIQFFSPYRFSKFIELYWSVWHPNVSIVHRPTFNPSTSKSILLAAMALIGACVSPDPVDNADARVWFNCVEEMVFTDDDFCSDVEPSNEPAPPSILGSWRKLQALQASYIVCLYQNWEGTDASKRRIRRHRFGTVVSVARDIGIETARHLDYSRLSIHEFRWDEYVVREELIRTFLWIFLLDTAFVIFNNLPHRMVIKEMKMHMASPAPCFQAATAEECLLRIHELMPPTSPFCRLLLRDAIEQVCMDTLTSEEQENLSQLGPLNLFAIVSAFHSIIFQHQNSFGVAGQLEPIRNGLRNWISIWERYFDDWSNSYPNDGAQAYPPLETMWKRVGFIRFSPEYWLLGTLLTDRIAEAASQEQPGGLGVTSRGPFQESTSNTGRAHARSVEPILDKYDQTSMRQVNDLITDFQRFRVE
ncbi:hypothetical protein QBC47DRAFT_62099 [Echria macrotheca]|uniref:Uncharacterized protein n=1 Tax=Echria macrotheca TaxID=438768 RepID=A0AAJ0B944_9PEZI|nr:hypothetical protein QBC47DRAFT_62099 [Echria macrotheca]